MTDTAVVASGYDSKANIKNTRLEYGKLEFAVTLRTILKELKSKSSETLRILDVGCGAGQYAIELAKLGHEVIPVDISPELIKLTMENAKRANITLPSGIAADVRNIASVPELSGQQFDAVLLLGPLYHLLEEEERIDAIDGCLSMLKPDGTLFASFVTVYAQLRDLASKDAGKLAKEYAFYEEYLRVGKFTRSSGNGSYHTTPDRAFQLVYGIRGTMLKKLVACEGFLGSKAAADALNGLDEKEFDAWVNLIMESAEDLHVLGASDHLLAVVEKIPE